jgi:hypothetical protein
MPSWATRCTSCEEQKFLLENQGTIASKPEKSLKSYFIPKKIEELEEVEIELETNEIEEFQEVPEVQVLQDKIVISAMFLGGTGAKIEKGVKGTLVVNDYGFFYETKKSAWSVGLTGLKSFQISGAGAFQTGGGWFGGGFGFSGAMQGAAMASMMNLLTTRTHFDCLLRILYDDLDLTFQILDRTPRQLEIDLTGLKHLVTANELRDSEVENISDGVDTLLKLSVLLEKGLISRKEFDQQKEKYFKKLQ